MKALSLRIGLVIAMTASLVICCCVRKPAVPPRETTAAVLCAGDSLMAGFGPVLEKRFGGGVRFIQAGKVSSGLCNRRFYDWNGALAEYLDKYRPAVVLMCPSTNDTQNNSDGKKSYRFFTEEWKRIYGARVLDLIAEADRHGSRLIWISPPVMGREELEAGLRPLCRFIESICAEKGVQVIDLFPVLSSAGGHYVDAGYINGKIVSWRYKDGIHITPAGNDYVIGRAVKPVLKQVLKERGLL